MSKNVIIIGAGGHAKVIADIIIKNGDKVIGFLDDKKVGQKILGLSVIDTVDNVIKYIDNAEFIIGIGSNYIRKTISQKYNLNWYTAIHPSAQVGIDVSIGVGTVVMANAVINPSTRIGSHCIINTGAVIEHDNVIHNYVHISPNATLCGTVTIAECTHIGAGATIKNNISVCADCIIGAGGIVINDIVKKGTYVGVPSRRTQ